VAYPLEGAALSRAGAHLLAHLLALHSVQEPAGRHAWQRLRRSSLSSDRETSHAAQPRDKRAPAASAGSDGVARRVRSRTGCHAGGERPHSAAQAAPDYVAQQRQRGGSTSGSKLAGGEEARLQPVPLPAGWADFPEARVLSSTPL